MHVEDAVLEMAVKAPIGRPPDESDQSGTASDHTHGVKPCRIEDVVAAIGAASGFDASVAEAIGAAERATRILKPAEAGDLAQALQLATEMKEAGERYEREVPPPTPPPPMDNVLLS